MLAKISLGLSVLLSIAVVYLLLNRNSPATTTPNEVPSIAPALTSEGGPRATVLAYLNGDSLNEKYKFITEKSKILESKYKSADRKVSDEYKKREKDAKDLMDYYQQNPTMSEQEKFNIQQKLAELEGEMQRIQEQATGGLAKDEENLQKELLSRVHKYLETYSKAHGIDYVMNYQGSINLILYGNGAYDITSDVIRGLNEEYDAERK
jgi:outer membrane protein